MKKNRPGFLLELLCKVEQLEEMAQLLFTHTTTSGIRYRLENRFVLPRSYREISLPWGKVRIKQNGNQTLTTYAPEYEDCKALAQKSGLPLKTIYAAALAALPIEEKKID